jgi:sugar/nucleoside kinase (ribokinase family)
VSDIIRYASAVAALNCRQLGGRSGLPNLSATEEFIAAHRENWDAQITKV